MDHQTPFLCWKYPNDKQEKFEDVLHSFWRKEKDYVNYLLSDNFSKFLDGEWWDDESDVWEELHFSWEEVIEWWLNYNSTFLSLIGMNPNIGKKFYLIFFSQIDINELCWETKKWIIDSIIDQDISEWEFRKLLNEISENINCKIPENPEEINNNWPTLLSELSPFMFDNFTKIPRSIRLKNNRCITFVKTWENSQWVKVYTIRYWVTQPNVAYPKYTWISTLLIYNNKFNLLKVLSSQNREEANEDMTELKEYLGSIYKESSEVSLNEFKVWKTASIWEQIIDIMNVIKWDFHKSTLLDAWYNEQWHRVLFIQTKNKSGWVFAQLEMNLFHEDWKNIIYIWSLLKDNVRQKFLNAIPGLLIRVRDIYKVFDNTWYLEIWSFIADKSWEKWVMRKDDIKSAISRYKR